MTLTISPPPSAVPQATRSEIPASSRTGQVGVPTMTPATSPTGPADTQHQITMPAHTEQCPERSEPVLLGRYLDDEDRLRQVVALPGARGSVLVVDRDATTLRDRHLVAHLAADEPPENAALVCKHYLHDPAGRWCRRVTPEDLEVVPRPAAEEIDHWAGAEPSATALTDRQGRSYRLELAPAEMSIPELRWHRRSPEAIGGRSEPVSIREAIASLESYEPVRTLTHRAIARHHEDPAVSIAMLRAERARIEMSEIVLNRGLRRAVLVAAAAQEVSMSEIAVRCGKVKEDPRGKASGETSWLARRLGIAPESGKSTPTPWIHTDVLALIARRGLGICPREVELG
jgi:hypothetical protein